MSIDLIQWPAALLGVSGSWFVGSASIRIRRMGFLIWIISNVLWVYWAAASGIAWGLFAMQIAFLITSYRGLANHNRMLRRERELLDGAAQSLT